MSEPPVKNTINSGCSILFVPLDLPRHHPLVKVANPSSGISLKRVVKTPTVTQMKISGFSFCRNATKLYYPVAESIRSALPLCHEFIVAVGRGDADDNTREIIAAIGDPKIRIIDTDWTDRDKLKGWTHSQQTNIALEACTGDWCLYVQADEVLHEQDYPAIRARCEQLLHVDRVEGLAFRYLHFWGDYDHAHLSHAWYPTELRIIRNGLGIRSYRSAQSFRRDGKKLRAAMVDATIYHYGWVRPPHLMRAKTVEMVRTHKGREEAEQVRTAPPFSYGSLENIRRFSGSHPAVMSDWIARFDWADQLQQTGYSPVRHRHDKLKYRILTWLEQTLCSGRRPRPQPYRRGIGH